MDLGLDKFGILELMVVLGHHMWIKDLVHLEYWS